MMYTREEKNKIHENLDKIKEYLETLQPQVRDRIAIDFGEFKTYADYSREKQFHLYIDKESIYGRVGGLGLDYSRIEDKRYSIRSTVYAQFDYAVALIQNWQSIKREIVSQINAQNTTIAAINSFEV